MSRLSTGKEYEKGVLYCTVRWSNHNNNVNQFMSTNYAEERYTDVSIACEGQIIKAHKMILAGCSPYFEALFNQYDAKLQPAGQQMCVVLDGMGLSYSTLQLILEFMYGGEIRVKKSDLEALVKGGIKLRVKGLDAVKLGDKQFEKPMEPRTVIGRSELKSPQAVKVPGTRPPTQPPVPAQSRRRLSDLLPKSWSVSNPKPTPPNKMVRRLNIPVSPEPVSPKAPRTEPPGSGDSDEDTPKPPEEHSNDKQSVELPSAERLSKETTPVESLIDKQPDPPVEPRSRSSSRTRSQKKSAAIPEESVEQPEESLSSSAPNESELKSEESVKTDTEENGESDVVSSKRRIIKKPARLSDPDFVKEINVPPVKKRKVRDSPLRKKLAEETAEPPTEEVAAPAEAPKKRSKGVFSIFCQEFREKLQEENPGESNSEVTRRLSTMWRNLEPTEKEKYCHPPKVTKK